MQRSSSRGFCMKGVRFSKAGEAHWKQLLSYFSTSHKNGWGIFSGFVEALITRSQCGQSWNAATWPPSTFANTPTTCRCFALWSLGNKLLYFSLGIRKSLFNQDRPNTPFRITLQSSLEVLALSLPPDSPGRSQAQFRRPQVLLEVLTSQIFCSYHSHGDKHHTLRKTGLHAFKYGSRQSLWKDSIPQKPTDYIPEAPSRKHKHRSSGKQNGSHKQTRKAKNTMISQSCMGGRGDVHSLFLLSFKWEKMLKVLNQSLYQMNLRILDVL